MEEPRRKEPTDFGRMTEEEFREYIKPIRYNIDPMKGYEDKKEESFLTAKDVFKVKFSDWKPSRK